MKTQNVPLSAIAIDAGTQVRAALNENVVKVYAERMAEGVEFPPIVLFHDGSAYYLADGFHRYMASKRVGFTDIAATVNAGTKEDALWFALGANRAHALQMSDADKRHAITLALQAWPEKSVNQIAGQIGVSQGYASEVKKQVIATDNLPERVTGKDGKSYPATRPKSKPEPEPSSEPPKFKSRAAVEERRERIKTMAEEGYTSRQIAAAIGMSDHRTRDLARRLGVDIAADRAVGKIKRHDSNRLIERIVMDADNITEGVELINFNNIDKRKLAEWIDSLNASRDKLGAFIRRLIKEQQKHGEAA